MAGSFNHITVFRNGRFLFRGDPPINDESLLCDDMGDGYEALEECFDMIEHLAGGDLRKVYEAQLHHARKRGYTAAAQNQTFDEWMKEMNHREQRDMESEA